MLNQRLLIKYLQLKEAVYKKYSKLHHVEFLEGSQVLVLSPHPDDDVFGCGGTLIRHVEQGHQVHIVYLCQGDKGISGMIGNEAAATREKEAETAAKIIGIKTSNLFFLKQKDELLTVDNQLVKLVQAIISDVKPKHIYLPSFIDNHHDHLQTNQLLKSLKLDRKMLISAFEIWTPLLPNRIVDISAQIEQKKLAMQAHESQLNELGYLDAIIGLNQYRGKLYTKKKMELAEAFLTLKVEDYVKLLKYII